MKRFDHSRIQLRGKPSRLLIYTFVGYALLAVAELVITHQILFAPLLGLGLPVIAYALSTELGGLLAFVVMDLIIAYRGRWQSGDVGASPIDMLFGLLMICILCVWIVRIRVFENQSLSTATPILLLLIFFAWSIIVSVPTFGLPHHSWEDAVREILNLLPLLVLPILFERGVRPESKSEKVLLWSVIVGGVIVVIRSVFVLKSNIVRAYFLFQTGRASNDALLAVLLFLLALSYLMTEQRTRGRIGAGVLLGVAVVGMIICFSRAIYLGCFVGACVVIWLGSSDERRRGIRRLMTILGAFTVAIAPVVLQSRVLRLMVLRYFDRFGSYAHASTDRSLLNRFVEWQYLTNAIKESPLIGHGFGAQFHVFNTILGEHSWMGFSHSSYLYMVFKVGLFAAILFFVVFGIFLKRGILLARATAVPSHSKVVVRAGVGFVIAFLIDAYASPDLDSKVDVIWLGLVFGYFITLWNYYGLSTEGQFLAFLRNIWNAPKAASRL